MRDRGGERQREVRKICRDMLRGTDRQGETVRKRERERQRGTERQSD